MAFVGPLSLSFDLILPFTKPVIDLPISINIKARVITVLKGHTKLYAFVALIRCPELFSIHFRVIKDKNNRCLVLKKDMFHTHPQKLLWALQDAMCVNYWCLKSRRWWYLPLVMTSTWSLPHDEFNKRTLIKLPQYFFFKNICRHFVVCANENQANMTYFSKNWLISEWVPFKYDFVKLYLWSFLGDVFVCLPL